MANLGSSAAMSWGRARAPEEAAAAVRVALTALLVGAAYYAGANIGLILRFPPTTPSVLWPPNSILAAALMLAPPARWPIYLAAALPAHLLATAGGDWPLGLLLALFATNCSEALIAAVSVRRWSDGPPRLDTLKSVLVFVAGAGLFAPFASSFLDAGVVAALRGEPYWLVWRVRFFANVLTELTVAPAIITGAAAAWPWIRRASLERKVEGLALAAGLVVVAVLVLDQMPGEPGLIPDLPHVPVALFLPIILWAAVRFGPAGVSASTLATTLLLTWAATHARGPFTMLGPAESILSLQVYLIVSAVPLMCLAGLIEERRRAQRELAERLRYEELIARLSGSFVHLPSDRMGEAFDAWLERIGAFLALDAVLLLRIGDGGDVRVAHAWSEPRVGPLAPLDASAEYPWTVTLLRHDVPLILERLADLPAEAVRDRESLRRRGVRSKLALPLLAGDRVLGGLAFVMITAERAWPEEEIASLRLVAEVFASALARKESEDALRESELMKSAILSSLHSGVAVLDRGGHVIAVNQAWARAADPGAGAEGASYLDACRQAARRGEPHAAELLAGIEAVLGGARSSFGLESPAPAPGGERWFATAVVALGRPEGGAVVSRTEVTEQKRAEIEAQRSRQELAHFTRVSAMGELTASIAHELNQPLTGILANAQAARRFLDLTPPPLHEVRDILADIVDDDKRAAEVIQRLRELLRKGETQARALDLDRLVQDVVRLLGSDVVIRDVRIALDLGAPGALVAGDRVQLQQVVLNLLLNGMEAVADSAKEDRRLVVRTRADGPTVRVLVEDSGPGLRPGTQDLVFDPFYTTKPNGMGMGLAISRSIVEAHGGAIGVESGPGRGAAFHFSLPRAEDAA